MNEVPCGPARDREVDEKLDSLLEFCGQLESYVKDMRRRLVCLEVATGLDRVNAR